MTKKEEFEREFENLTGKKAGGFKGKAKEFAEELNKGEAQLRAMFRAAVDECKPSIDEETAKGLGQLFDLPQ